MFPSGDEVIRPRFLPGRTHPPSRPKAQGSMVHLPGREKSRVAPTLQVLPGTPRLERRDLVSEDPGVERRFQPHRTGTENGDPQRHQWLRRDRWCGRVIADFLSAAVGGWIAAGSLFRCRGSVFESLGLPGVARRGPAAIKFGRLLNRDLYPGLHENEVVFVRGAGEEAIGFVTNGDSDSAREDMMVVVGHRIPGTPIDHRLVPFETGPLLPLVGGDSDGSKL